MIHVEVIDTFNKFLKLEPIWNNLVSMNEIDIPFLTFEWFSCWWNSYGDNKELLILIAKQDGEILGIAPFMITKTIFRCLPVRKISFLTDGYSNRADFILIKNKKEALSHIFKYLNSNYKFNLISCNYLLSGSSSDTILGELLTESNSKYKRNNVFLSPYILIDANWNNYLNNRSRSFRKKLKRIDNLFKRNGSYEIIKYSMNDIEKGMDELLCVSKNSWKHKKLTAIACNAKDIKFYSLLSKIASLKGWLNIWILRMNCKPIAFEFNLFYKKRYYSLKIGFDEMYGSFSPGVFLDNYVLKECFATGAKEFDLLGKNEEYKMRWANSSREHCQYYIFNNRVYGRMLCFLECRLTSSIKKILALVNYPILLKI